MSYKSDDIICLEACSPFAQIITAWKFYYHKQFRCHIYSFSSPNFWDFLIQSHTKKGKTMLQHTHYLGGLQKENVEDNYYLLLVCIWRYGLKDWRKKTYSICGYKKYELIWGWQIVIIDSMRKMESSCSMGDIALDLHQSWKITSS